MAELGPKAASWFRAVLWLVVRMLRPHVQPTRQACDALLNQLQGTPSFTSGGCSFHSYTGNGAVVPVIFSTCQCSATRSTILSSGTCSLVPYKYSSAAWGSAFGPSFPASSPWVTAVASTQVGIEAQRPHSQLRSFLKVGPTWDARVSQLEVETPDEATG
jgi:hypothetical protein